MYGIFTYIWFNFYDTFKYYKYTITWILWVKCKLFGKFAVPKKGRRCSAELLAGSTGCEVGTGVEMFGGVSLWNGGPKTPLITRWWFQIFFIFTPIWGRFPF